MNTNHYRKPYHWVKLFCFLMSFLLSLALFAEVKTYVHDENGFVKCFQVKDKSYVLDWDPFLPAQARRVSVFEIQDYVQATHHYIENCGQWKYIHDVPSEILRPVKSLLSDPSKDILFSIQQIEEGAHVFRKEKTAVEYISNRSSLFQRESPEVLTRMRFEVGDKFADEVIKTFTRSIVSKRDLEKNCQSLKGTCDYYLCQEMKSACGLDGYNLGFGYKYCSLSKFNLYQSMGTNLGRHWVTEVVSCLQKDRIDLTCMETKKAAFDSHPGCYLQAGFCQLPFSEKAKIFNTIKSEILSKETLAQGFDVLKNCTPPLENQSMVEEFK